MSESQSSIKFIQKKPAIEIKYNRLLIGYIYPPTWQSIHRHWKIRLRPVPKEGEKSKLVNISKPFKNLDEAKEYIKKHQTKILEHCNVEV